jgi:hypothetical protein
MTLEIQAAVVHSGQWAARLTGTQPAGWSYASAVKVPLQPGTIYAVRGWLRADALEPAGVAPGFKCAIFNGREWLTNFFTPTYDVSKLGTWQKLETTFTVPAGATTGQLALEKRTTQSVAATLYVDDVELVALPGK